MTTNGNRILGRLYRRYYTWNTCIVKSPTKQKYRKCHPRASFRSLASLHQVVEASSQRDRNATSDHVSDHRPNSVRRGDLESFGHKFRRPRSSLSRPSMSQDAKSLSICVGDQLKQFDYIFLRDACTCPSCVDPSTTQKSFQTSDIPLNVRLRDVCVTPDHNSIQLRWHNDIPGYEEDHITEHTSDFLRAYSGLRLLPSKQTGNTCHVHWTKKSMRKAIRWYQYDVYMNDDEQLLDALLDISRFGLIFLNGVPDSEQAVETIAARIGTLRDSFYGRTWNVRSVPEAKNVASAWKKYEERTATFPLAIEDNKGYTHQNLGLHMDLLYMSEPPFLQLLHCLRSTCSGGNSIFSDSFRAASVLRKMTGSPSDRNSPANRNSTSTDFARLTQIPVTYHYRNAGHYYHFIRPTIEMEKYRYNQTPQIANVNWSPPFQAPFEVGMTSQGHVGMREYLTAAKAFAKLVEAEEALFELKLQPGQCVIFNNRRVLHGRRAFDVGSGERWLKGAYLDRDVFDSRVRVLASIYNKRREAVNSDHELRRG
ncbi:MAG: hypothetical protein M1827_006972 [Pycnora praestabilis]|nr:MAG: hypothetical protein M1827_006972 [Pycnora praestabilis]